MIIVLCLLNSQKFKTTNICHTSDKSRCFNVLKYRTTHVQKRLMFAETTYLEYGHRNFGIASLAICIGNPKNTKVAEVHIASPYPISPDPYDALLI